MPITPEGIKYTYMSVSPRMLIDALRAGANKSDIFFVPPEDNAHDLALSLAVLEDKATVIMGDFGQLTEVTLPGGQRAILVKPTENFYQRLRGLSCNFAIIADISIVEREMLDLFYLTMQECSAGQVSKLNIINLIQGRN